MTCGCRLDLKLGVEIPQSYHRRLDQDANNTFKPMEYVGYEVMEYQNIVAEVAHIVPSKEESSLFFSTLFMLRMTKWVENQRS